MCLTGLLTYWIPLIGIAFAKLDPIPAIIVSIVGVAFLTYTGALVKIIMDNPYAETPTKDETSTKV